MAGDATTELVPQPHGRDFQKVLASQLSLGDVGEGAAVVATAPDRSYASNDELWGEVLGERVRATRVVHLQDFVLSEWFPLSPGLFHTDEAAWSRDDAQHHLLTGPNRVAQLEQEIGRSLRPGALDEATRDMLRVYSPRGKLGMMGGGVGCVRLNRRRLGSDDVWFMSASSTPIAHEGFPVVLPAALYEECINAIEDAGGFRCRLTGRLHPVPDGFDPLFRRVVGVPRLYLLAERLEARSRKDETFIATGALTFEAPGAYEQVGRRSDWEPVPDLHAAYVTFAAGNPASIRAAADWVASSYVSGLFGGRVVSDFDEHVPRFAGAPLEVARVAAAMLEPHAVKRIVDKTGPQRDVSELFAHRVERLSATACDFFISYTAGDRVWAEWIAWRLEVAGYTTVLQAWDFRPGGAWVTQIQAAMTTARRTIAVLSPDYLSSVHGAAEWQAAYAEDPDGSSGRLVPVRVSECQPEGLLGTRTWIDLIGLDADGARDALLAGIERRRAKPSREPAFPGTVPATPFPAP